MTRRAVFDLPEPGLSAEDLAAACEQLLLKRARAVSGHLFISDVELAANRAMSMLVARIWREQGRFNGFVTRDDANRGWHILSGRHY